jgi:DNA repair protein RadC
MLTHPPSGERPRERLIRHGAGVLTDPELLAVVLRTGQPGCDAVQLGRVLLERFGSLRGLFGASPDELIATHGIGQAKGCQLLAVLELARRTLEEDLVRPDAFDHPQRVKDYCMTILGHRSVEHCIALYLDMQLRLIACRELARGTLGQACVYPREVVRDALSHHAGALIIAHNHPSGAAQASQADRAFTRHLRDALALVDIRLVDHLIVASGQAISMAELGQI